ncbi:hypothetical protein PpBr36_01653 [Pyricularia pennisetigena]|uniref:hypothetical protein n=1 Tax=Pyricularia pennisetigena TaxID=1578925 RepID=UPI00114D9759|nr:hypothetical protein PpBr36_01653 [Pyricularia pennisetigena]TLS29093.1 hypothetical protein PpBr36_01653 [Pyricularia pennisetigena]
MDAGQGSDSAYYWTPMNNIGGFLTSEDLLDMDSCLNLDGNMSTTDSMSTDGVEHCNMFTLDASDGLNIKQEHSPSLSFLPGEQGIDAIAYASAADEQRQNQPCKQNLHDELEQQLRSLSPSNCFDVSNTGSNSDTEILRFEHLSVHSPRKPAAVPASAPVSRRGSPKKVTDRLAGVCSGIYKKASATLGRAGTHQQHQHHHSRSISNGLRQRLEREEEPEEGMTVAPLNIHRVMPTYEGLPITPPLSGRALTQQQQPFVSGPVEDPFNSKPNPGGRQMPTVLPKTPSGTPLLTSQDMSAAQQVYATANYAAMPVTSAASIDPELWAAAQFKLLPQFWDGTAPAGLPHVESAVPSPLAIDSMDAREDLGYAFAASAAAAAAGGGAANNTAPTAAMMMTRKQSSRNLTAAQANQHGTISMSQLDLTNDGLMIHMPQPRGPPHAATLLALQQQQQQQQQHQQQQQLLNQYHNVHQQQQQHHHHLLPGANFSTQPQTVPMLSPDVSHRPDHGIHQQQQAHNNSHHHPHHRRPKPKAPSSGARHTGPGGSLASPRKTSSGASPRKVPSHASPRKASGGSGSARSTTSPSPKPRQSQQQLLQGSRRSTSMQSLRDGGETLSSSSSATAAIRKRRSWASRPDLDLYTLESQQQHHQQRRQTSSDRSAAAAGSLSIGFVNYTAMDHDVLMAGVAPSGSSKTKARRERENREREDRMKEAFVQAVSAAGGDAGRFMSGAIAI